MKGLPRLVSVLERNEVRDAILDGDKAVILYDFITDTSAGAGLSRAGAIITGGRGRLYRDLFATRSRDSARSRWAFELLASCG